MKHWRPDENIIQGPWTRPDDYGDWDVARPLRVVPVVLGAVVVGLVAAGAISWTGKSVKPAKPDSPIEWNAVQAVPTRVPDAEDLAWEGRAKGQNSPSTGSGRTVEVVRGSAKPEEASLPSATGAQNIYVIDGDTFTMGGQRIRIAGIDAPETHPPRCTEEARLGLAATQKLRELLGSGTVTVSGTKHDRYGRDVRQVRVDGQDVGEAMIADGFAREYGSGRRSWCH